MNIKTKCILFTIIELILLSLIIFLGIWAIILSLIICLIELTIYEKDLEICNKS